MGRLEAVLKPLRARPLSDRHVKSVMCDYRYLHAKVNAGAQLGAVLAAVESLLQPAMQGQPC